MTMGDYNIRVQGKILHPNHELDVFHEMLADVKAILLYFVSLQL